MPQLRLSSNRRQVKIVNESLLSMFNRLTTTNGNELSHGLLSYPHAWIVNWFLILSSICPKYQLSTRSIWSNNEEVLQMSLDTDHYKAFHPMMQVLLIGTKHESMRRIQFTTHDWNHSSCPNLLTHRHMDTFNKKKERKREKDLQWDEDFCVSEWSWRNLFCVSTFDINLLEGIL